MFEIYFISGEISESLKNTLGMNIWELAKYLSPFIILIISFRYQKIRELEKVKKEKDDLYDLFKLLITDIIMSIPNQLKMIKLKIDKNKENNFEVSRLQIIMPDNFNRITEQMNNERLYKAYLLKHGNTDEVKTNFKKIILLLDYTKRNLTTLQELNEIQNNNLREFLNSYSDLIMNTFNRCIEISHEIERNNNANEGDRKMKEIIIEVQIQLSKITNISPKLMQEKFLGEMKQAILSSKFYAQTAYSPYIINQYRIGQNQITQELKDAKEYIKAYEDHFDSIIMSLNKLIQLVSIGPKEKARKNFIQKFFSKDDDI